MTLILRGSVYYLKKRVPVRFARVEPREVVWMPLATDSQKVAKDKAEGVWETMLSAWEAKLAGDTTDAERRFEAARELARMRGFRFLPVDQVAQIPLSEILARLDIAFPPEAVGPDMIEAAAVLGGAAKPEIRVSRALDIYFETSRDKLLRKSEDQIRRWKNPKKKAVANFIAVNGDICLAEIGADHMLDFKNWWIDRIEDEDLTANSANKDIGHISTVLRAVNEKKRLGLTLPLGGYALPKARRASASPFPRHGSRRSLATPG